MNKLLTDALGFLNALVAIAIVIAGAFVGYGNGEEAGHPGLDALLGLIVGFLAAVSVCGVIALLIEMHRELVKIREGLVSKP